MSQHLEFRTARPVSIESREDGPDRLTGYAAVFYRDGDSATEYQPWPGRRERIRQGAFSAALERGDDVRAQFDHGTTLLGRSSSGTLEMREDDVGLFYSISVPNTTGARDVLELVRRGDITGSSFMFDIEEEKFSDEGDSEIREIRSVKLYDVGPVVFPAYEGTSVTARSVDWMRHEDARRKKLARMQQIQASLTARE